MDEQDLPPDPVRDRQAIRALVDAIAFATDAGDWSAFRAAFSPDATGDFGALGVGPIAEIVDAIRGSQARYRGTMNLVATHLARLDGDRATAETYVVSHHFRRDEEEADRDDHVGTHYLDRLTRSGNGWRIDHREARVLWFREDAIRGGWLGPPPEPDAAPGV